jgi:hypothetical protein
MKNFLLIHTKATSNITDIIYKIAAQEYNCDKYEIFPKPPKNLITTVFQDIYLFFKELKRLKKTLKEKRYDKVFVKIHGLHRFYFLVVPWAMKQKSELIIFDYDTADFYSYYPNTSFFNIKYNFNLLRDKITEKYLFQKADKIVTKGSQDELSLLPYYHKLKNKPHYLFREFITRDSILNDDELLPKLSEKDGKIHIAYVGGIYFDDSFYTRGVKSFLQVFMNIISPHHCHCEAFPNLPRSLLKSCGNLEVGGGRGGENLVIHIYSTQKDYLKSKDYKNIIENYPNIIFHNPLKHSELIKQLSQYDFGIHWYDSNSNIIKPALDKTVFCNKYYDYILAKIPTIYNIKTSATHEFFSGNGLGIGFENISQINRETLWGQKPNINLFIEFIPDHANFVKFLSIT